MIPSPDFPFTETLTVVRPGGKDEFGDPILGTKTDVPGCVVWPRSSTETETHSDTVIVGLSALMPAGTDIKATDQVRRNGLLYAVNGEPGVWDGDTGIEVALTRGAG